jgi:hypothetical protein
MSVQAYKHDMCGRELTFGFLALGSLLIGYFDAVLLNYGIRYV